MKSASTLRAVLAMPLPGQILRVVAGVALLVASAKVQVPFWPVPMTLQVAAVVAIPAAMGLRIGMATLIAYMALGAAGLPVFSGTPEKGIGLAYMLGATGGYLAGFVAAVAIVGWAADNLSKLMLWPAMPLGLCAIYGLGMAWLAQFVPADKLLAFGLTPFVAGDLVKITLAAVIILGLPNGLLIKLRGSVKDA